jgi:hypothetical protein
MQVVFKARSSAENINLQVQEHGQVLPLSREIEQVHDCLVELLQPVQRVQASAKKDQTEQMLTKAPCENIYSNS